MKLLLALSKIILISSVIFIGCSQDIRESNLNLTELKYITSGWDDSYEFELKSSELESINKNASTNPEGNIISASQEIRITANSTVDSTKPIFITIQYQFDSIEAFIYGDVQEPGETQFGPTGWEIKKNIKIDSLYRKCVTQISVVCDQHSKTFITNEEVNDYFNFSDNSLNSDLPVLFETELFDELLYTSNSPSGISTCDLEVLELNVLLE